MCICIYVSSCFQKLNPHSKGSNTINVYLHSATFSDLFFFLKKNWRVFFKPNAVKIYDEFFGEDILGDFFKL